MEAGMPLEIKAGTALLLVVKTQKDTARRYEIRTI